MGMCFTATAEPVNSHARLQTATARKSGVDRALESGYYDLALTRGGLGSWPSGALRDPIVAMAPGRVFDVSSCSYYDAGSLHRILCSGLGRGTGQAYIYPGRAADSSGEMPNLPSARRRQLVRDDCAHVPDDLRRSTALVQGDLESRG